jgi:hypothetical protein
MPGPEVEVAIHLQDDTAWNVVRGRHGAPARGWLQIGPVTIFASDRQIADIVRAIAESEAGVMLK